MASVTITYQFDNGAAIRTRVAVDASYPDAVSECKAAAVAAFREACAALDAEVDEP